MAEVRIKLRRDTRANWAGANPILAEGEMGIELDTNKFKFGNGISPWNDLRYGTSESTVTKLSQLENDCNFITIVDVANAGYAKTTAIPTAVSQLTNDENYTTLSEVAIEGYTKNTGTVTAVNNVEPDAEGNVTLDIPQGTVKSVNNVEPDANGNVALDVIDSETFNELVREVAYLRSLIESNSGL